MPKSQKIPLLRDQLRSSPVARRRFLNWLFWGGFGVVGVTGCGLSSKHSNLEKLLQTQQWEAADRETSNFMWEVVRQNEDPNSPYDSNSFNNFPCDVLKAIDQLWVKHSQGKFGFSVQVKVWQEVGNPTLEKNQIINDQWKEFGNRVGWRKEGSPVVDVFSAEGNPYYPVSLASPQGILPFGVFFFEGILERERTCGILFSRVAACRS